MTVSRPLVLVPGDEPPMIAGSKHLDRIRERADLAFLDSCPVNDEEKIARAKDATVILNTRGIVRWPGDVLRRLPKLNLIVCCAIGFDCIDMATARESEVIA